MTFVQRTIVSAMALGLAVAPAPAQTPERDAAAETTARLNREQAEFARKQMADNAASRQAHDDGVRRQGEFEAEKARLAQQHKQAMTNWQADVDACNAGIRSRCAPAPIE